MIPSIVEMHVAKKQFGLDDDTYRAKLENITGKNSAKDMSEDERQTVLTVFRDEGFVPTPHSDRRANGRAKLSGKYAKKLQALWIAGWNLGIIHDRDDAALTKFVEGRTDIEAVRFLHFHDDANRAIEALKGWLARDGGVNWQNTNSTPDFKRAYGYRIAFAQFRKMIPGAPERDFWFVVADVTNKVDGTRDISDREWIAVMNDFGERIRAGVKS